MTIKSRCPWLFVFPILISLYMFCRYCWTLFSVVTRLTRLPPLAASGVRAFYSSEKYDSPSVFSEVSVARSLVFCEGFVDHCLSFCPIFLSVLLLMASDYPFGIFKIVIKRSKFGILHNTTNGCSLRVVGSSRCNVIAIIILHYRNQARNN